MQLCITFLTIIYIHIDLGPFQHTITLSNHTYNMYIYMMNVSPLSRSFLGLFSLNCFSTFMYMSILRYVGYFLSSNFLFRSKNNNYENDFTG
jgi:hypothetical protein